jgi:tetrahydromethanopterin S-methyltransferase subunit G
MHVMRESWTDERLDDFRNEVSRRFDEVDRRFDVVNRRFDEVDRRFERVEGEIHDLRGEVKELRVETKAGFESIHKLMFQGAIALTAAFMAGFASLIGLVATQI